MLRVVVLGARLAVVFRSGIAYVRFAWQREPRIPNFKVRRPRSQSAPTAITGF